MMKKHLFIIALSIACFAFISQNEERSIPAVKVKNLKGMEVNTSSFSNNGKPMIINFWATWCSPCKRELSNIADVYDDWVDETGVKIITIAIDDARSSGKVAPFVNGKGWDYEVYLDVNQDFKRAIGFQAPPFTCLVDGKRKIVYTHSGYQEGDEDELYELVKKLAAGKKISN